MRKIKVKSFSDFSRALHVFDTVDLADALVEAISRGIKKNNKKVSVCDIEVEEEREIFRLYSSIEDWPIALKGCMDAYIRIEEYEKCTEIQNLLKEYESKKVVNEKK